MSSLRTQPPSKLRRNPRPLPGQRWRRSWPRRYQPHPWQSSQPGAGSYQSTVRDTSDLGPLTIPFQEPSASLEPQLLSTDSTWGLQVIRGGEVVREDGIPWRMRSWLSPAEHSRSHHRTPPPSPDSSPGPLSTPDRNSAPPPSQLGGWGWRETRPLMFLWEELQWGLTSSPAGSGVRPPGQTSHSTLRTVLSCTDINQVMVSSYPPLTLSHPFILTTSHILTSSHNHSHILTSSHSQNLSCPNILTTSQFHILTQSLSHPNILTFSQPLISSHNLSHILRTSQVPLLVLTWC